MSISFIFTFAPVPLTAERSPLAHAAALVRRRESESKALAAELSKTRSRVDKKAEPVLA